MNVNQLIEELNKISDKTLFVYIYNETGNKVEVSKVLDQTIIRRDNINQTYEMINYISLN